MVLAGNVHVSTSGTIIPSMWLGSLAEIADAINECSIMLPLSVALLQLMLETLAVHVFVKCQIIKMAKSTRKRKTAAVGSSSSGTMRTKQSKRQTYEREHQSVAWLHASFLSLHLVRCLSAVRD